MCVVTSKVIFFHTQTKEQVEDLFMHYGHEYAIVIIPSVTANCGPISPFIG